MDSNESDFIQKPTQEQLCVKARGGGSVALRNVTEGKRLRMTTRSSFIQG